MTDTCTCHWQPARIGQPMDADPDPACPIHGAAVVSSSPDIPDEAVSEAMIAFKRESKYVGHEAAMRAALTAAYPALTRQAVAAERERLTEAVALYRASVEQVRIVLAEIDRGGDVRQVSTSARTWLGNLVAFYDHVARIARAGGTDE